MSCGTNPFGGSIHGLSVVPDPVDESSGLSQDQSSGPVGPGSGPVVLEAGTSPDLDQDHAGPGPEDRGELVLADTLPGRDMTPAERLWAFAKASSKRAITKWRNRKGTLHRYANTAPETIAQYRTYIGSEKSREWIPEGYEDYRLIKFMRGVQVVYHNTAGPAGVAFGESVAKTFMRGRRLAAVIACLTLAAILIAAFA